MHHTPTTITLCLIPPPNLCSCALCAVFKDKGCTAWSYDPEGWLIDRSRKCT